MIMLPVDKICPVLGVCVDSSNHICTEAASTLEGSIKCIGFRIYDDVLSIN